MLVLTRKVGEESDIGESMTIRIVTARRGRVRIGIEAPRDVAIRRSELLPPEHPSVPDSVSASGEQHQACRRHTSSALLDAS